MVKIHHGIVGFPDRLLLRPDGTHALVEFKRLRGGRVKKIQDYWHRRLAGMGHPVVVPRSGAEFDRVLTPSTKP